MDKIRSEKVLSKILKRGSRKTRFTIKYALFIAIQNNPVRIKTVKDLLAAGYNINEKNSEGKTALHLAVLSERPDLELVKLLLNSGADFKIVDNKGNTPLHSAVIARTTDSSIQLKVAKLLLDAGVNVNALNKTQRTAFNIAVNANKINTNLMKELLCRGADYKLRMKRSALSCVLSNKNLKRDAIQVLFDHGASVNPELVICAMKNPKCTGEIIEDFFTKGVDAKHVNHCGYTFLHFAVRSACNASTVETLLKWGASVNARTAISWNYTPLHIAARNQKCPPSVIQVLLQHGADVNAQCDEGATPLAYAAWYHNDERVLEELLKKGANPNEITKFGSVMYLAAINKSSNPNFIKILLKYGGNINITHSSYGITPLLGLLNSNYKLNLVKEMLRNGATRSPTNKLLSPLRIILKNPNVTNDTAPVIQEIFKYIPGVMYRNALFDALEIECPFEVFDELIKQGADVHVRNSLGKTPLHYALENPVDNMETIELFLKHDAWCKSYIFPWKAAVEEILEYSEDEVFLKLLIKYANLQKYTFREIYLPALTPSIEDYPDLLSYETECRDEFFSMSKLVILERHDGEETRLNKLLREEKEREIFKIFKASILKILTDNMYPIYSDVIARKLKKLDLIESAMNRKIHDQRYDTVLTADSIGSIGKLLSNECLANLLVAFKSEL